MQRTNFKLGTGGEIYLFSHRESVYCGVVGWVWAVCHGRRCQLQKADARTCGGRLYRLRQARPMARDGEGLGLPVGMRRSPSEDKRISRAHLLPMSRLLAEECRKRAAESAEKAEQQDDPERRREYLYLATIWRVIARESEDTETV